MRFWKNIILSLLLCVGLPIGMYIGQKKAINYEKNGIDVTVTVVSAETQGVRRRTKSYTVEYINKNGQKIYASAILNQNAYVGDILECKMLPETPNEVYKPAPKWLMWFINIIAVLFFISGILIFVSSIREGRGGSFLDKNGIIASADVLSIEHTSSGRILTLRFFDQSGTEQIVKATGENNRYYRNTCMIRYAYKDKKLVFELSK